MCILLSIIVLMDSIYSVMGLAMKDNLVKMEILMEMECYTILTVSFATQGAGKPTHFMVLEFCIMRLQLK
jgi:hypothetical protein